MVYLHILLNILFPVLNVTSGPTIDPFGTVAFLVGAVICNTKPVFAACSAKKRFIQDSLPCSIARTNCACRKHTRQMT